MLDRLFDFIKLHRHKPTPRFDAPGKGKFHSRNISPVDIDCRMGRGSRLSGDSLRHREPAALESFYASTGQDTSQVEPSINPCPFNSFWDEVDTGQRRDRDTIDHKRMKVRETRPEASRLTGTWHVKTPGHESVPERFKRYMQKIIYRITGQRYKAEFYNDRQLLAQKEVLAADVYKTVVGGKADPQFQEDYQVYYSLDHEKNEHCIASRHLEGFKSGSELVIDPSRRSSAVCFSQFHPVHNPVIDLVIRRFLLGDEDYLKLDNYMFNSDPMQPGQQRLLNIDFGMAFYNQCRLPEHCNLKQFQKRMLKPSTKHRIQYHGKHTMHSVLASMNPEQVDNGMKSALTMIADLTDEKIDALVGHIHQPDVREAMAIILKYKRQQAAAILNPEENEWPQALGRDITDSLVGRSRRT